MQTSRTEEEPRATGVGVCVRITKDKTGNPNARVPLERVITLNVQHRRARPAEVTRRKCGLILFVHLFIYVVIFFTSISVYKSTKISQETIVILVHSSKQTCRLIG